MKIIQINLRPYFVGGGEVFTAFLCRALAQIGVGTRLLVHRDAYYWATMGLPNDTELVPVEDDNALCQHIGQAPTWLLGHDPLPTSLRRVSRHWRTAIAHMPVQGRNPRAFDGHDMIFPVSGWVQKGLLEAKLPAWSEPLYGVADLSGRKSSATIRRTSRYKWDERKGRDRLFQILEPAVDVFRSHPEFHRHAGLTLGIVSQLVPVKQFPLLFSKLSPVLARHPDVRLEIFGHGGYASVRDLDQALGPCIRQVRFWGQQQDVEQVYRQLDYLLAGLPAKEALGLKIIEAQACGTPVIAVNAPPFTETVADGQTGFLYRDPREDQGADFGRLLDALVAGRIRPDPLLAKAHLARFSFDAFVERLRPVVAEAESQLRRL